MDLTTMKQRIAAAHALAAGHPIIGIGSTTAPPPPIDKVVREWVVLRVLLSGAIYDGNIQDAVDHYASLYHEVTLHA